MDSSQINHLAVFAAALSDMAVGALWYSPLLFHKGWMAANHFSDEDLQKGNPGVIYGLALVISLIVSYNLAFFLATDGTDLMWGLMASLLAGVGFAAMSFATISLFERRSVKYILINCGYIIVSFAAKGIILGAWR